MTEKEIYDRCYAELIELYKKEYLKLEKEFIKHITWNGNVV